MVSAIFLALSIQAPPAQCTAAGCGPARALVGRVVANRAQREGPVRRLIQRFRGRRGRG